MESTENTTGEIGNLTGGSEASSTEGTALEMASSVTVSRVTMTVLGSVIVYTNILIIIAVIRFSKLRAKVMYRLIGNVLFTLLHWSYM